MINTLEEAKEYAEKELSTFTIRNMEDYQNQVEFSAVFSKIMRKFRTEGVVVYNDKYYNLILDINHHGFTNDCFQPCWMTVQR